LSSEYTKPADNSEFILQNGRFQCHPERSPDRLIQALVGARRKTMQQPNNKLARISIMEKLFHLSSNTSEISMAGITSRAFFLAVCGKVRNFVGETIIFLTL